ncbi:MAG: hypothetical protein MUE45_07635 [Methanoregulaceae archaeon]|jgi:hypothetical protein|nr:hypothetical protein [Methanoregulaceae archaeon]MCU0629329.1 hypothetical protein [Methanoregulaceae archaeon]
MKIENVVASVCLVAFIWASLIVLPAYCNRIESGSTIDLSSGSVSTSASDRIAQYSSGLDPVEIRYAIRVLDTAPETPSQGSVSAYMNGLIQEGSSDSLNPSIGERIEFSEYTRVDGAISRFEKVMQFRSDIFS